MLFLKKRRAQEKMEKKEEKKNQAEYKFQDIGKEEGKPGVD